MKQNLWKQSKTLSLIIIGAFYLNSAQALIENFQFQNKVDLSPSTSKPIAFLNLRNWGLFNNNLSHINAPKAWEVSEGDKSIIVAVIDTGIDPKHPDLKANLWHKFGTDEYCWDFVTNKKNPVDEHGHGTHVAGIIGASAKSKAGATGVAKKVSIMAIRYYSKDATGAQNLSNTIKAINYAIDNGANIINYSGGGAEFSAAEFQAIKRAEKKGVLIA